MTKKKKNSNMDKDRSTFRFLIRAIFLGLLAFLAMRFAMGCGSSKKQTQKKETKTITKHISIDEHQGKLKAQKEYYENLLRKKRIKQKFYDDIEHEVRYKLQKASFKTNERDYRSAELNISHLKNINCVPEFKTKALSEDLSSLKSVAYLVYLGIRDYFKRTNEQQNYVAKKLTAYITPYTTSWKNKVEMKLNQFQRKMRRNDNNYKVQLASLINNKSRELNLHIRDKKLENEVFDLSRKISSTANRFALSGVSTVVSLTSFISTFTKKTIRKPLASIVKKM